MDKDVFYVPHLVNIAWQNLQVIVQDVLMDIIWMVKL